MGARKTKASTTVSAPVPTVIPHDSHGLLFAIGKRELRNAVQAFASLIDRRSSLPILANVTIRNVPGDDANARFTHVVMTGTDLNISLKITVPCAVANVGAGICVPVKSLLDTIKTLPDGDVTLGGLRHGGVNIASGTARASIQGVSDRDTPKFPEVPEALPFTTTDAALLVEMLDAAQHAICRDESRFHLNGTFLESLGGKARAVATDGHRLARIERDITLCPIGSGIIVPRKGCAELGKFLAKQATCDVAFKAPNLYVRRADGATLVIKQIDAQFPPYEQVIPKGHKREALVDIEALAGAVERAKVHTTSVRGIKLAFASGNLTVSGDNPDTGGSKETIECEYTGEDFAIGVSANYLAETLACLSDEDRCVLSTGAELDPIMIRGADDYAMLSLRPERFVSVIMPMRT